MIWYFFIKLINYQVADYCDIQLFPSKLETGGNKKTHDDLKRNKSTLVGNWNDRPSGKLYNGAR